jgi:hypothetical protein
MPAKRPPPRPAAKTEAVRVPKALAISADRRALIEAQVNVLSASARKVAIALPLAAEDSDFLRILDEAGRG